MPEQPLLRLLDRIRSFPYPSKQNGHLADSRITDKLWVRRGIRYKVRVRRSHGTRKLLPHTGDKPTLSSLIQYSFGVRSDK